MNILILFMLKILICFTISIVVLKLLKPALKNTLHEICGTRQRAEFWVMFTQLMSVIAPLLIVAFFAPTELIDQVNPALMLKETLFQSLLGIFIALAMVGQVIWKSIQLPMGKPATDTNSTKGAN